MIPDIQVQNETLNNSLLSQQTSNSVIVYFQSKSCYNWILKFVLKMRLIHKLHT